MRQLVLFEIRLLNRSHGPWVLVLLLLWTGAAWLQEPAVFRRHGVQLLWSGAAAGSLAASFLLPLPWILAHREGHETRFLEGVRGAQQSVITAIMGLWIYSVAIMVAAGALCFTLDSISGFEPPDRLPESALHLAGLAAGAAAAAPAVARNPGGALVGTLLWVLWCTALLLFSGVPSFLPGSQGFDLLNPWLSAAAALCLSVATWCPGKPLGRGPSSAQGAGHA